MRQLVPLAVFFALGGLSLYVIWFLAKHPFALVALILGVYLADTLYLVSAPMIRLGSLTLYAVDIVTGLAFGAGLLRLFLGMNRMRPLYAWALVVFMAALAISAFRGIPAFGVQAVGNSGRSFFYFISTVIFGASLPADDDTLRSFFWVWIMAGWGLLAIAAVRWVLVALGQASNPDWMAASGADVRVLNANETLFILQVVVIAWYLRQSEPESRLVRLVPLVFLPAIVVMQQRTVWVILLASIALVFLFERNIRAKILAYVIVVALVASIALTLDPSVRSPYAALESSAQNTQTLSWRMEGWMALLNATKSFGPTDYAVGQPMGTGYNRYLPGANSPVTVAPHDYYLQVFLILGAAGLLMIITLFLSMLTRLMRADPDDAIVRIFLLLTVAYVIFFITYGPNYQDGFVMGLTLSLCGSLVPEGNAEAFLAENGSDFETT